MKKSALIIVLATTILTLSAPPLFAQGPAGESSNSPSTTTPPATTPAATPPASTTPAEPNKASGSNNNELPGVNSPDIVGNTSYGAKLRTFFSGRTLACIADFWIGLPIAWVRRTPIEVVSATKDLTGDTDNKWIIAACAPLGLVGGLVGGPANGLYYSARNAGINFDHPFTKDAISLGSVQ